MSDPTPSRITQIYKDLIALVQKTYPDHKRMWSADAMEDNPDPVLRQAWGLRFTPGRNTNRNLTPQYSRAQGFALQLCREFPVKASDPDQKELRKLVLLEDAHLMIVQSIDNAQFSPGVISLTYLRDGGVLETKYKDKIFATLEVNFEVEYSQPA